MNKGTSRKSREIKALAPDYIVMDERSMQDMVVSTLDYSKTVNYFDNNNKLTGNWESFFLKDPIFIIAYIAKADLSGFKEENDKIFSRNVKNAQNISEAEISNISNNFSKLTEIVHEWRNLLTDSGYKGGLVAEIIQLDDDISKFQKLEKPKNFQDYNNEFNNIHARIFHFKETITEKFSKEIVVEHAHLPHIGLILTFFKLFEFAQEEINQLTKKHLDYYYRDILKEKQHSDNLQSHSAMIACRLKQGMDNLIIDKDATFNFDFGGGYEGKFLARTSSQLNNAFITDIKTIYKKTYEPFESRDGLDPFCYEVLFETDILKRLNTIKDNQADTDSFKEFPIAFGEENVDKSDIGFIISSPSLILEKGDQEIHLEFKLVKDVADNEPNIDKNNKFDQLLDKEFELYLEERENNAKQNAKKGIQQKELTNQEKEIKNKNLKKIVEKKFFDQVFNIYITNEEGWKLIDYSRTWKKEDILSIQIPLNSINEQLVSFDPSLHNGNYDTEWPCIKILLNNEATYHPYIFVKNWNIEYIRIVADVSGVSNLKLSNSNGEINNTIPFAPFGPIPQKGSFLRVQNPLILQKSLSSLELSIHWNGLPQIYDGFKKYYQEFYRDIENDSFKAYITHTRNLESDTYDSKHLKFNLFESKDGYLKPNLEIPVSLGDIKLNNKIIQLEGNIVPNKTSLYLVLNNPDIAFGHNIFAQIYAKAAMQSSRLFKKSVPLPNQPYTPLIDQLKLNYKNTVKENVLRKQDEESTNLKLFHLYPFGQETVFPGSVKSPFFLFPQIVNKGNLFIGLQNLMPEEIVSIGFDLIPAVNFNTVTKTPKICWKFLNNNKWENFMENVLEDGTRGLIRSGIVKLKIPSTIQIDNTRLAHGKFWIKAEYDDRTELNSRVKHIFTQAVSVRSETILPKRLFTEKKAVKITPIGNRQIENISAPIYLETDDSTENDMDFYTRISERLRHKNRGRTNWDIERIILEKFNRIEKVRVYGRNNYPNELVQGCTTQIVVVPKNISTNTTIAHGNKFDIDTLQEIKNYIKNYVSPFVKIEVCNPVFEELKVRCRIQFTDDLKSPILKTQLNQDLITFLSPESGESDSDSLFEKSFTKTEIYKFIKARPYVKKIKKFSVIQLINVNKKHRIIDTEDNKDSSNDTRWRLRTISAYAILTSAPLHHIEIFNSQSEEDEIKGIGDIAIGSDFIITKETDDRNIYIED